MALGPQAKTARSRDAGRGWEWTGDGCVQITVFSPLILHSKPNMVDPLLLQALSSVKSDRWSL